MVPLPLKRKSLFASHVERWKDGCGSDLCSKAKNIVFAKGDIPADILICGEASGDSEDVIGKPFVGPAGHLMMDMVDMSIGKCSWPDNRAIKVAYTNLLCCRPVDEEGNKVHEPPPAAVKSCAPRLKEFVTIAKPKLIVLVGKSPGKLQLNGQSQFGDCGWLRDGVLMEWCEIVHPAAILRSGHANEGLLIQKTVVKLMMAVEHMLDSWEGL